MDIKINYNNFAYGVKIKKEGDRYLISIGNEEYHVDSVFIKDNLLLMIIDGKSYETYVENLPDGYFGLHFYNDFFRLMVEDARRISKGASGTDSVGGSKKIIAPMAGKVLKLNVHKGDRVKSGDTLVIIEAMKMQNEIKAAADKVISEILIKEGDSILPQQPLIILSDV